MSTRRFKSPIIQITQDSVEHPNVTITTTYNQDSQQLYSSTTTTTATVVTTTANTTNNCTTDANTIASNIREMSATKNLENMALNERESSGDDKAASGRASNSEQLRVYDIEPMDGTGEHIHVYKRRFFILTLFCAHSAINSFQWIQYSTITNVITKYYDVSSSMVNLTSTIYMITYIPFIIQASLMLERIGLKKAIIIGTLGTAFGSLIKWWLGGAPSNNSFWLMMVGQTIVALSQLFIISIPPLLAAVWFPDNQVSTATGIGVFGNQLGIALGFIVPPWVIGDYNKLEDKNQIGSSLNLLSCGIFWISLAICIVSILAIEDKPPMPPGSASLHAANQQGPELKLDTYGTIKSLCKDADFIYLILSYGVNVGVFYAVSTVLNQIVEKQWPQFLDLAGTMGLLLVVSGMAGSVICGQLLDKTHAYKLIITLIYLFSLVSMLLFTLVIELFTQVWPLYLVSIILGFFMTGYLPLGFEFAAEITYPHPANTPAGLLNLSAQVFGLLLTNTASYMVEKLNVLTADIFLTCCLALGLGLTIVMKAKLRRQRAIADEQMRF